MNDPLGALDGAHRLAGEYLRSLPDRPVSVPVDRAELLDRLETRLPEEPMDPAEVVSDLASQVDQGLVASSGPRYFGFVTGGTFPAAMAADWLTSTWDQNTALWAMSPAAGAVTSIVRDWLLDLLRLPEHCGLGLVTGAQMANWTCLAAARHKVLADAGWDVEADGLIDAPRVTVIVGQYRHNTIDRALRFLGFGAAGSVVIASDSEGRMQLRGLEEALARVDGPVIVCAQAGEVNTGAFDDFHGIVDATRARGVWVHVDGAFGLWARASGRRRHLTEGVERADSWSIDGHKWLNVPYDTGFAITAHPEAHAAAMMQLAPYLAAEDDARHDQMNWSPDASRRARAFATYAAIRSLGRRGIDDLIDRCCRMAQRLADGLGKVEGIRILNEVVLNQVLVRFGDDDAVTDDIIARVQADGTCWAGGTTFEGRRAMRVSVSGWTTTDADIDASVEAIIECSRLAQGA